MSQPNYYKDPVPRMARGYVPTGEENGFIGLMDRLELTLNTRTVYKDTAPFRPSVNYNGRGSCK